MMGTRRKYAQNEKKHQRKGKVRSQRAKCRNGSAPQATTSSFFILANTDRAQARRICGKGRSKKAKCGNGGEVRSQNAESFVLLHSAFLHLPFLIGVFERLAKEAVDNLFDLLDGTRASRTYLGL